METKKTHSTEEEANHRRGTEHEINLRHPHITMYIPLDKIILHTAQGTIIKVIPDHIVLMTTLGPSTIPTTILGLDLSTIPQVRGQIILIQVIQETIIRVIQETIIPVIRAMIVIENRRYLGLIIEITTEMLMIQGMMDVVSINVLCFSEQDVFFLYQCFKRKFDL